MVGVAGFKLNIEFARNVRDGSADQRELAATSPTSPYYAPQTRHWRIHDRLSEKGHVPHPAMPDGTISGGRRGHMSDAARPCRQNESEEKTGGTSDDLSPLHRSHLGHRPDIR